LLINFFKYLKVQVNVSSLLTGHSFLVTPYESKEVNLIVGNIHSGAPKLDMKYEWHGSSNFCTLDETSISTNVKDDPGHRSSFTLAISETLSPHDTLRFQHTQNI
jgi:hypothetical protein